MAKGDPIGASQPGPQGTAKARRKVRFWDTWHALALFVAALLGLRFWIFEPFKIPSGSMEPTLIGHEDYGDRIVTNKLAYWGAAPKRFEVLVFKHDSAWEGSQTPAVKNYIKRLVGLPGETVVICGGDLYLETADQEGHRKEDIIRKWEYDAELQARLWQPVARARFVHHAPAPKGDALAQEIAAQEQAFAFPWEVAKEAGASAEVEEASKCLRVEGGVALSYAHLVTNVYVKMGRWPFRHEGCPLDNLPPVGEEEGPRFRDPRAKSKYIRPYLPNSWSGVRCPNCGQRRFPLSRDEDIEPRILPDPTWGGGAGGGTAGGGDDYGESAAPRGTLFFYGGYDIVTDLRLDVDLEVVQPGGYVELEVGADRNYAAWRLSLGGEVPAPREEENRHEVTESPRLEPGRKHSLSLAYVDASVLAALDGRSLAPLRLDLPPPKPGEVKSRAQVRFGGEARVRLTRLDLFRDLYWTLTMDDDRSKDPVREGTKDFNRRRFLRDEGKYRLEAPPDCFLMLGDNSPSSKDGRVWGFVPKQSLVGRASFIWWPPSRWRVIY
jgi:signal peptidase I